MGYLSRLFATAGTPGPFEDYWYQPVGTATQAGVRIDAEGAKKLSAWFRGRFILASAVAIMPLKVFRRLPNDGGREEVPWHPLYDVLHRQPNIGDDDYQFKLQAMFWLIDHGRACYDIVEGSRGFVDQLDPIEATLVTPERMKRGPAKGRYLFHVRDEVTGQPTTKTQDEVFYLRGAEGKGVLEYARDTIGLGFALDSYAGRVFRQGGLHGTFLKVPGPMTSEARQEMEASFSAGLTRAHTAKVLWNGADLIPSTMDPEKLQMILSRKFTVTDIARWLGLPPHMLADLERSTNNNIEHQGQEFVTYSLGPWLKLWESAINTQLILKPAVFYAEFVRDALVQGDLATRWQTHVAAVNAGIKSADEARVKENLPKRGGKADELREPQNITGRGAAGGPQDNRRPGRTGTPDEEPDDSQALAIVQQSAARLLRKEIAAAQKCAVRHAADEDAFAEAVTEFYAKHATLVAETLQIDLADANDYCAGQSAQLLNGDWIAALELWGTNHYAAGVAALALGEAA